MKDDESGDTLDRYRVYFWKSRFERDCRVFCTVLEARQNARVNGTKRINLLLQGRPFITNRHAALAFDALRVILF